MTRKGKINRDVLLRCLKNHLNELFNIFILTKNVEVEERIQKQIDYINSLCQTIEYHTVPEGLLSASSAEQFPLVQEYSSSSSETQ